jgi:hypothetical protein
MTEATASLTGVTGDIGPSTSPRGWTWLDAALLVTSLVIAACVRFYFIDFDLTYDELWHEGLSTARGSSMSYFPHDVLITNPPRLTSNEGAPAWWRAWAGGMDGVLHPPLYIVTLRWWRDLFGDSDLVAISYSIAWSLVGVAFTFASMRLATDRWLAFVTAIAMGVSQTQSYFSQEVRGYSMLVGLGAITLWLMTRIEVLGPTRRRAVAAALMTAPLLLTHYFAVGAAISIAIYGLIRLRGQRLAFILSLAGAALFYAVAWLPWAIQQIDDLGTGDVFMKREFLLSRELAHVMSAPMRLVVDRVYLVQPQWMAGGVLFVLPFLLVRRARWLLPWALWLTCTLLALFALDLARSTILVFMARYYAVATPAVFMLVVGCASCVHRRAAYVFAFTLAGMGSIYLISNSSVEGECPTFTSVERALDANIQDGDGLIFYHGVLYSFTSDALALQASHSPKVFPRPIVLINGAMKPELVAQLPRRVWMVTGIFQEPVETIVPGAKLLKRVNPEINVCLLYLELPEVPAAATRPSEP